MAHPGPQPDVVHQGEADYPVRRLRLLTAREREVLALLASGASNARIGDVLCLAEKTIESHTRRIMCKLGLQAGREANVRVLAAATYWQARLEGALASRMRPTERLRPSA